MRKDYTQFSIARTTRERLRTFGRKGETWDEVLNRLMDEVDK